MFFLHLDSLGIKVTRLSSIFRSVSTLTPNRLVKFVGVYFSGKRIAGGILRVSFRVEPREDC